ncbi:hypothetical protein IM543_02120 [Massilia sp. UMI-21]|nr:hypothetical protein IM543_02120 [Massilia sp. UMI-21]
MSFEIGVLHKSRPHLLADLAELLLLVGYDNLDELSQAKLELLSKEMPAASDSEDASDDDDDDEHAIDKIEEVDRCIEDCWQLLEYREAAFDDFYPFRVIGNQLVWKAGARTEKQCAYFLLLICSRLRSFRIKGFPQKAAKEFTSFCKEALKALAPPGATVRVFDANSDDRRMHYGTNLRNAIKVLAKEIGAHYINEAEIAKIPTSGDMGLDLVSSRKFVDFACGAYSIFGQCGAQENEWPTKTLEAHPIKFQGLFTLLNQPDNLMFIPISYRDSTGDWVAGYRSSGCLLLDRQRILELVNERWADCLEGIKARWENVLPSVVDLSRPAKAA